ncbi:MAG: hypothetical protein DRP85_00370 [Candidatus Makaraimicrobium thalassicum]|nr:MAG: hypothetical protein DRP85_00370 [Candidatus Omnitrophota bacterium]
MPASTNKKPVLIKVIALLLSISMLWQGVVWAEPDAFSKHTLQPQTLFTRPGLQDTFLMLASGYLGVYLNGIENDPRNQNVARIRSLVNSALAQIRDSEDIPPEFKKTIPHNVKLRQQKSAVIMDMGQYKIRYFNHRIPGSEIPSTEESGISYEVLQTYVGRYLSRQILIQKALSSPPHSDVSGKAVVGTTPEPEEIPEEIVETVQEPEGDLSKSPEDSEALREISDKKWKRALRWNGIYLACYCFIQLGIILSGWAGAEIVSQPVLGSSEGYISGALALTSLGLWMWARSYHPWRETAGVTPQILVVSGPYRYLRHPVYSAMLMISASCSVFVYGQLGIIVSAPLFVLNGVVFVLFNSLARSEEEELTVRFGEEYRRILRRTYSWLPRLFPQAHPGSGPSAGTGYSEKDFISDDEKKERGAGEQRTGRIEKFDLVSGLKELSGSVANLLQEKELVVIAMTGNRGAGKTTVSKLLGQGFAGARKEEILVIEQDAIHNLRKIAEERQEVFNDGVKRDGAGKKIIIVEGFYASENFGPKSVLKTPDVLVILEADEKIRQRRVAERIGSKAWLAQLATVIMDGDKEPVYPEAEYQLNITNNIPLQIIKDDIENVLRPGWAKKDVSVSEPEDRWYSIFPKIYKKLSGLIRRNLMPLYAEADYAIEYLEKYGWSVPAFSNPASVSSAEHGLVLLSLALCAGAIKTVGRRPQLEKARRLLNEQKYDEVKQICGRLREPLKRKKNKEDYVECLNLLGFAYNGNKEFSKAGEIFKEAIAEGVKARVGQATISIFFRQNIYSKAMSLFYEKGDVQGAVSVLEQGKKDMPYDTTLSSLLGEMYYEAGDMASAEEILLKVLDELPEDEKDQRGVAYYRLGMVSLENGDVRQAEERFYLALERRPDSADVYHMLGWCESMRGEYEAARTEFQRARELGVSAGRTAQGFMVACIQEEKFGEAIDELRRALEADAEDPNIYRLLLNNLPGKERLKQAFGVIFSLSDNELFKTAMKGLKAYYQNPKTGEDITAVLAEVLRELRGSADDVVASRASSACAELDAGLSDRLAILAIEAANKGDLAAAERYFDKAEGSDPRNVNVLHPLGDFLISIERYEEGIKRLEQAKGLIEDVNTPYGLDLVRDLRDAYVRYEKNLLKNGKIIQAGSLFRKALITAIEIDKRKDKEGEDSKELYEFLIDFVATLEGSPEGIEQGVAVLKELLPIAAEKSLSADLINFGLGKLYYEKSKMEEVFGNPETLVHLDQAVQATGKKDEYAALAAFHIRRQRGYIYLSSYDYRRAKQDFDICLQQQKVSEEMMAPVRIVASVIDEASGNHSGVIKRLNDVDEDLIPASHQVILNKLLGDAYYGIGDLDRALKFYQEALSKERTLFNPVIRVRLGRVYRDIGEPEKAVESCELALKEAMEDMDMVPAKGREDIESWIQNLGSNRDRIPVFNIQPLSEVLISMGALDVFSEKEISGKSLFDMGVELGRQEVEARKAFSNKVPDADIDLFAGIRKEVLLALAGEALQSENHAFWGEIIEALGKTGGEDIVDYLLDKLELPFLKGEKGLEPLQNFLRALLWTRESRAWEQVDRVMAGQDKRSRKKIAKAITRLKKELGRDEERSRKAEEAEKARKAREAEEAERLRKEREEKKAEKAREAKEKKARQKAYRAVPPAVMEILGPEQVDAIIDEAIQQGESEETDVTLTIMAVDALSDRYIKYHRLIGEQRDELAERLRRERISLPEFLRTLDDEAPATGWKQTVEVSAGELYLVEFGTWKKYEGLGSEGFEPEVILEVRSPEIDRESLSAYQERLKEALVESGIYRRWSEAELETLGGNLYPGTEEDQGAYDDRWDGIMDFFAGLFTEISTEIEVKEKDTPTAPEKTTMKAPGSLSMDEDRRIDKQYITGLVSKATERTWEVNIPAAADYINRHAPPLKTAHVEPGGIRIFTVDSLGDKLGIPRFKGAEKAPDLVYAYGVFDEEEDDLKIYATEAYFDAHLKDDILALAEIIDHEYTENVLGYSHRAAASRSRKFVPEGGFLSPFHYFYINRIIEEGDYLLAGSLVPERDASDDIVEANKGDKDAAGKIQSYEKLFFSYLRLLEWLSKADKEKNHDVLAEYALRAYKILERYPEIILTEGQKEIYQRISPERFYIHEYESAKKVSMPLSEFPFDEFEHYGENTVFLGSKFGSRGGLYCKGKKKPLIRITEHPGRKIAFNLKNGDIYRIWILDDGDNVIDFRQMGQIYETDGRFRKRFYYKITRSQFNELGDCIIKEHRLDAAGTLHIGGRVVRFGAYYANCKVEIKVRSGQIDSVWIFDEHGLPVKKADFVLIFDCNGISKAGTNQIPRFASLTRDDRKLSSRAREPEATESRDLSSKRGWLKGSFYRNLTRNELEKLDNVTLKRLRLNSRGARYLGGSKDPVPYFPRHPNAEVEIDMIQGHIDKVRILGSDGEVVEEHIFKLVYDEEGRITCSFHKDMAEDDFEKITGRITRLKTGGGGHLRAGTAALGTFTGHKNCPAEAEIERGIPKVIRFYEDMETRKPAGKPVRYSLIYDAGGRLIDSFRKQYSKAAGERLKKATVKEFYLNKGASLKFGERYWATFDRKEYGGRKIEFDVTDGIVTEVRIFDRQGENIEKTCPFSLVYEIGGKGKEKLVDSFWTAYGPEKFEKLTNHVIRTLKLSKYGALDIGGRVGRNKNMPRAKFPGNPGAEVVVYVKEGEVIRVTDIAGDELEGTYFGRDKTGASGESNLDRRYGQGPLAAGTVDRSAYRMPKKPFEILKEKIKEAVSKGEIPDGDHERFLSHGLAWTDKGARVHFIRNSKIYTLAMEAMNTGSGAGDQIKDYHDLMGYINLYLRTKYIIKRFRREYKYDIVKQVILRLKDYPRYIRLLEFYRDQYGKFAGEDRKGDEEALLEDMISRFVASRALGGGAVELLDEKGMNRSLDDFWPLASCVIKDGLWMFENELDKIKDIIFKENAQLKDEYKTAKEKQERLKKRIFQLLNEASPTVKQLIEIIRILDPQAEARSRAQEDASAFEGYLKEDMVIIAGYLRSSGYDVLDQAVLKKAFVSLKGKLMVIDSFDMFVRAVGGLDRRNMIDAVFEGSINFESALVSHMRGLNGTRNMGSRLRSLTAASGLSSDQAAEEIGCSPSTMRAWRTDESDPLPGYPPKIADVFSRRLGEPVSTSLLVYGQPLNDVLQKTATFGERLFILARLSGLDADETGKMIGRDGQTIGSWTREFNTPQQELDYLKLAGIFSKRLKEKIEVTTLMSGISLDEFLCSEKVKAPNGGGEIQVTPGLRIRVLRLSCGLTTTELAEKAGVPHGTRSLVNKWEREGVLPRVDRLLKLSRIFGKVKKDIEVTHILYGKSLVKFLSKSDSFGERVESIRLALGLELKQMAEAMGIHLATLRVWRKRVDPPANDKPITLLDVYHRETGKYLDGCLLFYGKTLNTLLDELDRSKAPEIIKYFRISAGLSRKEVSDKLGVDENTVWQWESGVTLPHRSNMVALTGMFKELFASRDNGISVRIVAEHLVPLLLIPPGHTDRGPALFVDPATGDVRALKGEPDAPGMISEHKAINLVCDELVFKRQRPPLAAGDPLYDFVSEVAPETDIYVIDDAALKQGLEKLARKNNQPGLAGLAGGLITHAGTWRDPETGRIRALNMFIPASVYELLLGFLQRRHLMEQVVPLLGFWRAHEIGHLIDREYDLDDELPEGAEDMARLILLLSKAQWAMEKGRLKQAQKYADTALELHPGFDFTLDLRLRIEESGYGMSGVRVSMMAVLDANMRDKAMIIRRHPPEDNVLDTLAGKAGKDSKRLSQVIQVILQQAFETIKRGGPALAEFLDDLKIRGAGIEQGLSDPEEEIALERGIAEGGMQDIGDYVVLPVVCRYITRALEQSPKLTWQMSVVEKLMDLAGKGRIGSKTEVYHEESGYRTSLLSYIYYLGARAYMAANLNKAVMYFEKSTQQDRPMPVSFTGLALSLVESDRTEGSFERAYQVLGQARDNFGDLAVIAEAEGILHAEQEKTALALREARELFKSGNYVACRQRIEEETKRLHSTSLFPSFKKFEGKGGLGRLVSGRTGSAAVSPLLTELNARNETLLRLKYRARQNLSMGDYDQAERRFREVLDQNPSDSEIEQLLLDISRKREEAQEKRTAEELGLFAECLKKAEGQLSSGDREVSDGRLESAEEYYKKALLELERAPQVEMSAVRVDEKMREAIRRIDSIGKEIAEKIRDIQAERQSRAGETGVIFSGDVAGAFDKALYPPEGKITVPPIPGSAQRIILEAVRKVSEGDERDVRDIPSRGDVWVCLAGIYRIVFTLTDSGDIFVVWVGSKDTAKYKKVLAPLPEGFDPEKMLDRAVRIEDIGSGAPARPVRAQAKNKPGGPALFVDPVTRQMRALKDEPDAAGMISEHEAVNMVCDELVFKQKRQPLSAGDPLYDFFSELVPDTDIYVIDDAALKQALERLAKKNSQPGLASLAEGLITHVGTWRDPATGRQRAQNMFIPDSVYGFLVKLLKKRDWFPDAGILLEFWRLHERIHFLLREIDIDGMIASGESQEMAELVLLLSRAERALEKGMLEEASEYAKKAIEVNTNLAVTLELNGRISEVRKDWDEAFQDYLIALAAANLQSKEITIGHPLESRVLNMLKKITTASPKKVFRGVMDQVEFLKSLGQTSPVSDEDRERHIITYFGILPVTCRYATPPLQIKPAQWDLTMTRFQVAVADRLLELLKEGKIVDPMDGGESGRLLSYIYYLAGEASRSAGDIDQAVAYFRESVRYDEPFSRSPAALAVSLAHRDGTPGSVEEAYQVLSSAEEQFGPLDVFSSAREYVRETEEWILVHEEALELFRRCDYEACQRCITEARRKKGETALPAPLSVSLENLRKSARLADRLKNRGIESFKNQDYMAAEKCFEAVLEENPADEEVMGLRARIREIKEERQKKTTAADTADKRDQATEKCYLAVQKFRLIAERQENAGRLSRASKNYRKALAELEEVPPFYTAIGQIRRQIEKKLAAIKGLPDKTVRKGEKSGPQERKKKKKRKRAAAAEPEIPGEIKSRRDVKVIKRQVFLSREAVDVLTKKKTVSKKDRENILVTVKTVSQVPDREMLKKLHLNLHGSLFSRKVGKLNVIFTIMDDESILVLRVGKLAKTAHKKMINLFPEHFDYRSILKNAVRIEDLEKKPLPRKERPTMKAPGSLSMDEDRRVDKQYITGLVSKATERTGEVSIPDAADYINRHAPPLKAANVEPGGIRIFTVDSLGDKMGIPRFKGAEKASDLVYAYGVFNEQEDALKIYVTRGYFDTHLKGDVLALAEIIDHEYTENVLGYSHRVAASRSRRFVPKGGFLSPFHYFYINRIISEGDYSLANSFVPGRSASEDVIKAYKGDKDAIGEIESYERLFFRYLLLSEWLRKADAEKDHNILVAEYASRAHEILESAPEIVLTEEQSRIYKEISPERFRVREYENARKGFKPLSGKSEEDDVGRHRGEKPLAGETVDRFAYRMPRRMSEILEKRIEEAAAEQKISDEDYGRFLRHGLAWIDKGPKEHFEHSLKIYFLATEVMNTGLSADNQIKGHRQIMKHIKLYLRTRYVIGKFKGKYGYDAVKQVMARLRDYPRYTRLLEFYRNQYGEFVGKDGEEDEEALIGDLLGRFVANRALGAGTVELLDENGMVRRLEDFWPLASCVIKNGLGMLENELDKDKDVIFNKDMQLKAKYKTAKDEQEQLEKRIFQLLNKAPCTKKELAEVIRILDPEAETRLGGEEELEAFLEEDIDIIARHLRSFGYSALDRPVLTKAFVFLENKLMTAASFDIFLRVVGFLDRKNMIDATLEAGITFESALISHMRDLNGAGRLKNRLRSLTAASGLSVGQAAEEVGCSVAAMLRWRIGEYDPLPRYLPRMAEVFSGRTGEPVSTSVLVYGEPLNDVLQRTSTFGERLFILARLSGLGQEGVGRIIGRKGATIGRWTREVYMPKEEPDYFKLAGLFSKRLKKKIDVATLISGISLDKFLRRERVMSPKGGGDIQVTPGLRIKVLRMSCGLTTGDFAWQVGVSRGTSVLVDRWQRDEAVPLAGRLAKMTRIFSSVKEDIEVTHILYGKPLDAFLSESHSFGERVETVRLASGLTNDQMSKALKVNPESLRNWRKQAYPGVIGDRKVALLDVYHRQTGRYLDGCLLFYGKALNTLLDELDRSKGFQMIRYFRLSAGLSLKEVSDSLGVGVKTVKSWEEGLRLPYREDMLSFVELFEEVLTARGKDIRVKMIKDYFEPLLVVSLDSADVIAGPHRGKTPKENLRSLKRGHADLPEKAVSAVRGSIPGGLSRTQDEVALEAVGPAGAADAAGKALGGAYFSGKDADVKKGIKGRYSKYAGSETYIGDKETLYISALSTPFEGGLRKRLAGIILGETGSDARVLSVGVGTGIFEHELVKAGCDVTGVDITPEVLKRAEERGISTIEADASDPAFWMDTGRKQRFDAVLFVESMPDFEPDSIFDMAKQVLTPGGRIYVLTRDDRKHRREEEYKKALQRQDFEISRGSGTAHFGEYVLMWMISARLLGQDTADDRTDAESPEPRASGLNMRVKKIDEDSPRCETSRRMRFFGADTDMRRTAEPPAEISWGGERIMENSKAVIPWLVQAMIDASEKISEKEKKEKVVLLLDTELAELGGKEAGKEIERLIRLLAAVKSNNNDLKRFLKNLEIVKGKGRELLNKRGTEKAENIIVVTKSSNVGYFKSLEGSAVIAAVDDKEFPNTAYLPLLEVTLFAIGKHLGWSGDVLLEHYRNIPNAVPAEELSEKDFNRLFRTDMRNMVIRLIPDAARFDTEKELVEMMARVRKILTKA